MDQETNEKIGRVVLSAKTAPDSEFTVNVSPLLSDSGPPTAPKASDQDQEVRLGLRNGNPMFFQRQVKQTEGYGKYTDAGIIPTTGDNVAFQSDFLKRGGGGEMGAGIREVEAVVTKDISAMDETSSLFTENGFRHHQRMMIFKDFENNGRSITKSAMVSGGIQLNLDYNGDVKATGQVVFGVDGQYKVDTTEYDFQCVADATTSFGSRDGVKARVGVQCDGVRHEKDSLWGQFAQVNAGTDGSPSITAGVEREVGLPEIRRGPLGGSVGVEGFKVRAGVKYDGQEVRPTVQFGMDF